VSPIIRALFGVDSERSIAGMHKIASWGDASLGQVDRLQVRPLRS